MLHSLHINDFVIVNKAEINFDSGFTVFSGETGAGKSILIDALSLALGARTNTNSVRNGAERTNIVAIFDANDNVNKWLQENDIVSDQELLLRRTIDAQGRSRAYINGIASTLSQVRELASKLIDIHGQHAHQNLLKGSHQRILLDNQSQCEDLLQLVSQSYQDWQNAVKELDLAISESEQRQENLEKLHWHHEQISALGLAENEWQDITQKHKKLAHSQSILKACSNALNALDNDEDCTRSLLNLAFNEINGIAHHDKKLEEIANSIDSAMIICADIVSELNHYCNDLDIDPSSLDSVEQRMSEVFEISRRLNAEPEDLLEMQDKLEQEIATLQTSANLEELQKKVDLAFDKYEKAAQKLSKTRQKTAKTLANDVSQAMQELAMHGGSFGISLNPCQPSKHGNETIEFLVAGHAGAKQMPLAQVASGGELARISLALSVIASKAAQVPTLIFDEVDTGIGGKVAEIVGKLLQQLGQRHQVLCVTHLAQVAACAGNHFVVSKQSDKDNTISSINKLDENQRIEEIARMLGGIKITATTKQHAIEMLNNS